MRITRSPENTGGLALPRAIRSAAVLVAAGLIAMATSGCRGTPYNEAADYQDLGRFTYPGVNIGGGLTRSFEDFDITGSSADDTTGFHFRVGGRGSRYLAFEAVYERSLDFDINPTSLSYSADAITLNFKVYPTGGLEGNAARLQPYLSAGGGALFVNGNVRGSVDGGVMDNNEFGGLFRAAGGVDFYLTENVLLTAEYARLMPTPSRLDDFEYDNVNLGIQLRF